MGKVQEIVNKLRGKGKAIFLSGLVLFGSSTYVKNVKAEEKNMIPTDYFNGFVFERLPIKTIFDMTIEEGQRKVVPYEISLIAFKDKTIDRTMFVPVTSKTFSIIKDSQKNSKNNKKLLEENKGILLSELKKHITEYLIKNLNHWGGDPNKVNANYELISGIPVSFGSNDNLLSKFDFYYLSDYSPYDGIKDNDLYYSSYSAYCNSLSQLIDPAISPIMNSTENVPFELLNQEMTIEKYLTDVYMKIIPYNFWPVNITFIKDNVFIPEFSEEKRNQDIISNNIGIGFILKIDDTLGKIIIYIYNENSEEYFDFYTGQKIELEKVVAGTTINGDNYQFEEAYHVLSGYGNQVANVNQIFLPFRNSIHPIKLFEQISYKYSLRAYYDLIKKIDENTTIGELVDAYQTTLPLEYTIDYTGYDFSNNPDIVNASESKSPQLVKTPGN